MCKWTIGMPSYNNFTEVYFTVQSLRMHHDMTDKEIDIIDNYGDDVLARFVKEKGCSQVRYDRCTGVRGVSIAKNRIFEIARGEFVLCIDSHVLLKQGVFDRDPSGDDFIQGPMLTNSFDKIGREWLPQWRANMWGIWKYVPLNELPAQPYDIWAIGAGFFATRRDTWLKFNPNFRGFGGETGYIQEKYRKAGRRVLSYPNMQWTHYFCNQGRTIPFPVKMNERIRNYIIGFMELGLDTKPILNHFGKIKFERAAMEAAGICPIR